MQTEKEGLHTMKKLLTNAVLVASLISATSAQAEFSGEISLTNDYRFRGVSQSGEEAAIQGGISYFHDSGFYAGWWGSSVDYYAAGDSLDNNESFESDYYIGYYGELNENLTYDATLYHYTYPGSATDVDYSEINVGVNYKALRVSYWHANDYFNMGDYYSYIEADYTFELPNEFGLTLHAGHSFGGIFDDPNNLWLEEYTDYSVTLNKSVAGLDLSLAYMDTDIDDLYSVKKDYFANSDAVVFSVSKSF
ncbi:TorF family putative porin [Amphritea sp. 1_MG-2023]|uniref:TorF family putative porin n=1 Tax=Amphritea sp. 1_MG-2023 TaxID=3062670 RepID=UPI0026E2FA8B|nr:TorF family putative porin [Amphritea sp. 1_MG-2023]MDO6563400.1 TorF family putative porin [Amphritea sp. 1_MG-2023]